MVHTPPLILIVDDDWMNRELLQAHLTEYACAAVTNGEKALEFIADEVPDLVMLDLRLPGISGYEVCARLKADARTASVPVLIISALESEEARRRAVEAGADDFLPKPLDSLILHVRVRSLLRCKLLADELIRREQALWHVLARRVGETDAQAILEALNDPAV